jgi:hypothetical protein
MKQILQNLKTGKTELTKIPCPETKSGHLLIKTTASLISAGTERITGPQITCLRALTHRQAQIDAD